MPAVYLTAFSSQSTTFLRHHANIWVPVANTKVFTRATQALRAALIFVSLALSQTPGYPVYHSVGLPVYSQLFCPLLHWPMEWEPGRLSCPRWPVLCENATDHSTISHWVFYHFVRHHQHCFHLCTPFLERYLEFLKFWSWSRPPSLAAWLFDHCRHQDVMLWVLLLHEQEVFVSLGDRELALMLPSSHPLQTHIACTQWQLSSKISCSFVTLKDSPYNNNNNDYNTDICKAQSYVTGDTVAVASWLVLIKYEWTPWKSHFSDSV